MGLNAVINDVSTPEDAVSRQYSFEPAQYGRKYFYLRLFIPATVRSIE